MTGNLELRGVKKSIALKVRVETSGPRLTAVGRASLKHSDFGITPVSVAGVVKVKDELAIDFRIVARSAP